MSKKDKPQVPVCENCGKPALHCTCGKDDLKK